MKKIIVCLIIALLILVSFGYCSKEENTIENDNKGEITNEKRLLAEKIENAYNDCLGTYSEAEKGHFQTEIGKCIMAELGIKDNVGWANFVKNNNLLNKNYTHYELVSEITKMINGVYLAKEIYSKTSSGKTSSSSSSPPYYEVPDSDVGTYQIYSIDGYTSFSRSEVFYYTFIDVYRISNGFCLYNINDATDGIKGKIKIEGSELIMVFDNELELYVEIKNGTLTIIDDYHVYTYFMKSLYKKGYIHDLNKKYGGN